MDGLKPKLTVTGSIDDSSLVALRWYPPELRGGSRVANCLGRCSPPVEIKKMNDASNSAAAADSGTAAGDDARTGHLH